MLNKGLIFGFVGFVRWEKKLQKRWKRIKNSEKTGNPVGSKGCYFRKSKSANLPGRWQVQIRKDGKTQNFGYFLELADAEEAYKKAKIQLDSQAT